MRVRPDPPSITVGHVKRLLASMDDRVEFKIQNGQTLVSVRGIVPAQDNAMTSIALVIPIVPNEG
jgi:hypothetical protein